MILNYIDPKFCNVISFQSDLGDFDKNIAVFIALSQMRIKEINESKIKDTTVQTTLDDFGLEYSFKNQAKTYKNSFKRNKYYWIVNLDYWLYSDVGDYVVVDMMNFNNKTSYFNNKINKAFYNDSVDDINSNVHLLSDGSFEMLNPKCTHCGSYDVIKKDTRESYPKVEYHGYMKLKLKRYYCKNCGYKFQTKIASVKDDGCRFSKSIKGKVRESFANRGGSLDQIAKDLEIFLNVDISHQEIKNMLKFDFNEVEYYEETIPQDNKKDDSECLKSVESDKLYMLRKKNPKIMGYLVVDELFLNIKNKRWYAVFFHDISNKNVPFAVGVMKSRTKANIKRVYDVATRGMEITALTSDHFTVYESIADDEEIMHQTCIYHHFDNLNDDIYPILKDKSISDGEKMSLALQTTEYRNIFRTYDEKEALSLWESFLDKGNDLHYVFKENAEKITESFLRHTQFTRDNFIPRTSNQAETFHSLPVVRQIKNTMQTPKGFLECIAIIMQYHKPTSRKSKRPQSFT